jgi:hypothetical protein
MARSPMCLPSRSAKSTPKNISVATTPPINSGLMSSKSPP